MDAVTGAPEPLDELVAHARETHVVVIGGGIAGLVAAWECAKLGMAVTLVEASGRLGGVVGMAEVAGLELETGATCFSTRDGVVRRLIEEVDPDAVIVRPGDDREWIAGLPKDAAAPLPRENVLGIPANAWDESVRNVIGWGGAWRAYLDRLRPPLTIGSQRSLGRLVRGRMGARVHDRLVAPLSIDRFGLAPDDVDVEIAAPGLNPALTRTGSLGAAVSELRLGADRAPAIEGIDGGMPRLVHALHEKLVGRGVDVRTGTRAVGLERLDARWTVKLEPDAAGVQDVQGAVAAGSGAGLPHEVPPEAQGHGSGAVQGAGAAGSGAGFPHEVPPEAAGGSARAALVADAVVVATDEESARMLLAGLLADEAVESAVPAGIAREVVTLVVDGSELDAASRGVHVHAVPGAYRAVGVAHDTARWPWLAQATGPGRHVVRVAFGAPDDPPATADLDDADAAELALAEASALLGVTLGADRLVGAHRARFTLAPPASARGRLDAASAVRSRISRANGVAAVGAWLSGSGLAQVVSDAQDQADRLRRALLFGADARA
ncbi:NAD(P)-binding protein [Microbacterium sp. CFH 90308]|uniref:NAD(P)-binding protein n=1 Tax=Microbacterium salsuginis TaxID=2722803 RepID=A0ABX1KBR9_9MICO|nr:FAD-dependent oxidoreductase [Microbacterium sp. CFH 90308]NLP83484.1 NAD(P)-binding protein [Microbacterium sp. CFH 90308]